MTVNMNDKPVLWVLKANIDLSGETNSHAVICIGSKDECMKDALVVSQKLGFRVTELTANRVAWVSVLFKFSHQTMILEPYSNLTEKYINEMTRELRIAGYGE